MATHKRATAVHQIELRIGALAELFNSMDPTPFHHCDLDTDAQEYLESWAMGYPSDSRFRIIVHIQEMPSEDPTQLVVEAVHNYFEYRTIVSRRNLQLLLAEGRTSLVIGLSFLAICLLGADLLTAAGSNPFWRVLKESLLIGGWVAMWRPMQIFLYEWWPLVRKGRIFQGLSHAKVQVIPAVPASNAAPAGNLPGQYG